MAGDGKQDYVDSYEDVSMFALASDAEADMLARQTECVFMWTTAEHDPVGVIMSFVHKDGRFWLTATRRRKRIRAIEARPRVAVAVSSRGTNIGISRSVTYKGRAILHDDEATKKWYYPALAAKLRPGNRSQQEAFIAHLSSPGRVVIEIVPDKRIGFDTEAMFANSPAGPDSTQV
ncbi:MAG: pyridoxamine 5'-phosphate oxidase family protein [Steroidobacteraceae bacterium]